MQLLEEMLDYIVEVKVSNKIDLMSGYLWSDGHYNHCRQHLSLASVAKAARLCDV